MTVVTEGIAQSQRESFFVANLYTVKGEIHEARAALLDADDKAKAKTATRSTRRSRRTTRRTQINTELQKQLMESE